MEDFILSFPFAKVDEARRVVTGIATADNIDPAGDIIDFDASKDAFNNWVGNIREMHQPKAVGKGLAFREVAVPYNGHVYDGIEVEAYVSKGAEDTWQKILDGTLRGFSVGGQIIEKEEGQDKNTKRRGRKVSKYSLGELSLVDNPGNPAALISLIKRAPDGTLEYLQKYDIFYCAQHNVAQVDDNVCGSGNHSIECIGSVDDNSSDMVRKTVLNYLDSSITIPFIEDENIVLKGQEMTDLLINERNDNVSNMDLTDEQKGSVVSKLTKVLFGVPDEGTPLSYELSSASTTTTPAPVINIYTNDLNKTVSTTSTNVVTTVKEEEILEKAEADEETEEVVQDDSLEKIEDNQGGIEVDIEQMKEMFSSLLDEKLTSVKEEISKSVDEKVDAIQKSVDEVGVKAEEATAAITEVTEKVEKVESSGAFKKSVEDAGEEKEEIEKSATESFWGGIYVPAPIVAALGYDS